jgi:AraC-like DNA-binding protein
MRVWDVRPGRLIADGGLGNLAVHHHPAVQVTVGGQGPLTVTHDGAAHDVCSLVVVASGARHAAWADSGSAPLTLYFGLQTPEGVALNTLAHSLGQHFGIWMVDGGKELADSTVAALDAGGPDAAADFLVDRLCGTQGPRSVHPQLRQAMQVVSSRLPDHVDVASIANAVALSPDYLGRLCKQQTGVSFSATIRWARLVTAASHILDGRSVTDAAHLAGFADGSHATKVCWEMTGASPRELARAVRQTRI